MLSLLLNMPELAQTIRSIPLFAGLSREDIAKVLGKLEEKSITAGATIFAQGDEGDAFYLVEGGAVEVVIESGGGRKETVAVLGAGDWFGEMALMSGEPRSATIIALTDTALLKLSREAWDELINKHPSWLLHFCATLSRKLAHAEQQYSQGRDAFYSLAEEFYGSRTAEQQQFLRRAAVLQHIDAQTADKLLDTDTATFCVADLAESHLPLLIRAPEGKPYELHPFFRDFLNEKLRTIEGKEIEQALHRQVSARYAEMGDWPQALHHALEAHRWSEAARILTVHKDDLIREHARFVHGAIEQMPADFRAAEPLLVPIKAAALAQMGDYGGAVRTYKEALSQRAGGTLGAETVARYQGMADSLLQKNEHAHALQYLRSALNLLEQEPAAVTGDLQSHYRDETDSRVALHHLGPTPTIGSAWSSLTTRLSRSYRYPTASRWFGGTLGVLVWAYFWFWTPDIGLEPAATKIFGLLCLTLIYWVFWVFPDYGVALIFALGLILTGLAQADVVFGGFGSTSWFMTLGVLGLGAAITSSGLFYRLSLQLVRVFPLNYYWQIIALGLMGIVVMALIPQQSARTAIISQMLVNLSESLGYKTPSRASTGLFVASFLGLGQLGFLFLTGSTTSLIAWGLLPEDVRAQMTWGYWFTAALIPTLIVVVIILGGTLLLYRPESHARISYRMVENQLGVLGPLSRYEWITLAVLWLTIIGWLTASHHKIDGAWIALVALCVLVNTGVLGWGMLKKGIDWEMLLYMGATLAIPTLLSQAKIDKWLVDLLSPFILPFVEQPAVCFIVIALITFVVKLAFTSFLTVVTLTVALLPLAPAIGVNPWVMVMIILMASEVWFFSFQVDWHTLAYATTERKGFSYQVMSWINPLYAVAYIVALMAAIPYWRYLGLMR